MMASTKAHKAWVKKNTTYIGLQLNHNTDKDILSALEGRPKQTEIKRLIRFALSNGADLTTEQMKAIEELTPDDLMEINYD